MKILLPIDESKASDKAVQFVGNVLSCRADDEFSLTLLHVVESIRDSMATRGSGVEERSTNQQVHQDEEKRNRASGQQLLERQRQTLVQAGLPVSAIDIKLLVKECLPEAKKVIAALAIIEEMQGGDYSVIALGRRGSSAAQGQFLGSVAEKVLRESNGRTVWVID